MLSILFLSPRIQNLTCVYEILTGCNIVVTPLNSILSSISPYCKWLDHSERRSMYCTDYHILYPYSSSHCPPASPKPHYTNVSLISCPPLNQHPVLHLDAVCATIRIYGHITPHFSIFRLAPGCKSGQCDQNNRDILHHKVSNKRYGYPLSVGTS